jgi:hypothetical protein
VRLGRWSRGEDGLDMVTQMVMSLSAQRDADSGGLSVLGSTVNDDNEEHGQVQNQKCERFEERKKRATRTVTLYPGVD